MGFFNYEPGCYYYPKRGATIAPAELRFDPIRKVFSAPGNYILTRDQGLSQAEIVRKVGVSEQAVSWRVKRNG
jgi:hypothetical protein